MFGERKLNLNPKRNDKKNPFDAHFQPLVLLLIIHLSLRHSLSAATNTKEKEIWHQLLLPTLSAAFPPHHHPLPPTGLPPIPLLASSSKLLSAASVSPALSLILSSPTTSQQSSDLSRPPPTLLGPLSPWPRRALETLALPI